MTDVRNRRVDRGIDALQDTLLAALRRQAEHPRPATAVFPESSQTIDMAQLDDAARRFARHLIGEGVVPGDLVGLLVDISPEALIGLFGIMYAGAAASVLPVPGGFSSGSTAGEHIRRIVTSAEIGHLVTDEPNASLAADVQRLAPHTAVVPVRTDLPGDLRRMPSVSTDDLAIVQFTSGTTGTPRGVMLPHRTTAAGLRAIRVSAEFTADDRIVQWVPLYHDLGLFGMLANLLGGNDTHLFSPMRFIRNPAKFLGYVSEQRATIISGPNFSYELMLASLAQRGTAGLDLSCLRLAFNGAEPVSAEVVDAFQRDLRGVGVEPSVMYPVYGMAEATLAVTFPDPDGVARSFTVDRDRLGTTREVRPADTGAHAKRVVSVGTPVDGLEIRLVDESGAPCPDGLLGEIQVRGPSVTTGYYRAPEATHAAFDGAWLRTGDLGFMQGGELFVAGRHKEMAIVHGQNYFPEDVEAAARQVAGVYRQRCVAFADVDGDTGEFLGVVVESRLPETEHPALAEEVRRHVARELGRCPVRVHVVPPRWLTKTTSGKWQRGAARRRLAEQSSS